MNQEERRQFVRDHRTCVFGYGRKAHGPAMTIVYYVMDGDDLLISTMAARGKAKAVTRDGRVSLCVLDEQWPPSYLQVYGTAEVDHDLEFATDILTSHPAHTPDPGTAPVPATRTSGKGLAAAAPGGSPNQPA